jgi:hypothetical protein
MTYDATNTVAFHLKEAARLLHAADMCANAHSGAAVAYQAQIHIELAKALQASPLTKAEWDEACV